MSNPGSRQWDVPSFLARSRLRERQARQGHGERDWPRGSARLPRSAPGRLTPKKPDTKKLATHVKFYGSESIAETMNEHGIKELPLSAYATDAPEGRRMTESPRSDSPTAGARDA